MRPITALAFVLACLLLAGPAGCGKKPGEKDKADKADKDKQTQGNQDKTGQGEQAGGKEKDKTGQGQQAGGKDKDKGGQGQQAGGGFDFNLPPEVVVQAGEKKPLAIKIVRAKGFDGEVKVSFRTAPPKLENLKIEPAEATIPSGKSEANVTLNVAKEAFPGQVGVTLLATPEPQGEAKNRQFTLKIVEGQGGDKGKDKGDKGGD